MSNEELVAAIQAGDQNRMCELWEQVRPFIKWKALRVMAYMNEIRLKGATTIEVDDFIQSGYIALVSAVETYIPESGSFANWLHYALQTEFAKTGRYRTVRERKDPINAENSIDRTLGEDGDGSTLGEIIPDANATKVLDSIEEKLWREQLESTIAEMLSKLPENQKTALHLRFFENKTMDSCAVSMGISSASVQTHINHGLHELSRPHNKKQLLPFYEFDFYIGTGLQSYRHSGMSIQERYLIKKERAEERRRSSEKSFEELRFRVAGLW